MTDFKPLGENIKTIPIESIHESSELKKSYDLILCIDVLSSILNIPEILYICRERKIYGKKNKSTIKSIFNSHDYPKIKNER